MASKRKIIAGIDPGSTRTRCVIFALEDDHLRFLGASSVASKGWQKGRAVDMNAISASIASAVSEAESRAGVLLETAVVGVGGPDIESMHGRGLYEFPRPHEITSEDLAFAVGRATRISLPTDRVLIHVFPQDFTVDGRAGYRYPVGAVCSRLEANVLLITTSQMEHDCIVTATQKAHLYVDSTVFEPVAAAYACVLGEERERGVAVVDLGSDATGVVIYDGDAAVAAASLPITSDHLTRDLVAGLRYTSGVTVSYENAEVLKREYGCACLGLTSDGALIDVPAADGRGSIEITRRQLNEVLEARAEELFLYVRNEAAHAGMDQSLLEGVFLTGAGARLNGMCDMAERVLKCPAKYGLATGIDAWPQNFQDPAWSTVAGLAMYSARLSLRKTSQRKAPGLFELFGMS
jgi:cell division protein FtsA